MSELIAAIQMCSSTEVEDNLSQATTLIAKAANAGARMVVLPEMFACLGGGSQGWVDYQESPGSGKVQDFLAEMALKHQIWLVGGTLPIQSANPGKNYSACFVYDDHGKQQLRYDKIHLFDAQLSKHEAYRESDGIISGSGIQTVSTPFGQLGVCVCFDIRFLDIFLEFIRLGAEIIAVPAAFSVPTGKAHWEVLMRCRALDTFSFMIGASQSGVHPTGRQTYGHSLIVNPWGEILDELYTPGPGVALAQIDLQCLNETRAKIPVLRPV